MDTDILTATRLCLRCGESRPVTDFLPAAWCPAGQLQWCAKCRPMQHHEPKPKPPRPVSKTCSACGAEKLLDLFPCDAHRRDGHKNICRQCDVAQKKAQHQITRKPSAQRVIHEGKPSKVCPLCRTLKPLAEYVRDQQRKDGRAYMCKACKYEREKRNRTKNAMQQQAAVTHIVSSNAPTAAPEPQAYSKPGMHSEAAAIHADIVRGKWVLYAQVLIGVQDHPQREQWECWLVETVPADDASREEHQAWIKQVKELIR